MILRIALLFACCGVAIQAAAQTLPSEPLTFGAGRVVLGGDAAVSMAPDDEGFFNYSDYEHSTLRELRLGLTALVRATDRISLLAEIRSENLDHVSPFALYARIRPFARRRLDLHIGRIPPTFGSFPRQMYSRDNPLIGSPLAYQYLTSLRADAAPADEAELLRMRGRGWLSNFSVGNTAPDRGVPLVTAFNWDTGVQVTTGWRIVEVTGAVTNGTLSNPRVGDDNAGKQIASRVTVAPVTGLVVGSSFARGPFMGRRVLNALGGADDDAFTQTAHGLDVEYSRDHWVVKADVVSSAWVVPLGAAERMTTLDARAIAVEGRYTLRPGFYAAARVEHLGFSRITSAAGTDEWDAPVRRLEIGGGYYLQRNLIARLSLQVNRRDGGRVRASELLAGQLLFWF